MGIGKENRSKMAPKIEFPLWMAKLYFLKQFLQIYDFSPLNSFPFLLGNYSNIPNVNLKAFE